MKTPPGAAQMNGMLFERVIVGLVAVFADRDQ
jgi:hypothetical protein